jgi:NAD(P)H-hydrate epimerase
VSNPAGEVIVLSRAQVREVDRRAMEEYGIPGVVLMENAGRSAAEIVRGRVRAGGRVAIVCGRGNNGGDGYVIARHLSNAGLEVRLLEAFGGGATAGDAAVHRHTALRMGLECHPFDTPEAIAAGRQALGESDVVVDALLGTGFAGAPRPPLDAAIEAINRARPAVIVAVDVPSGLDCDTGHAPGAVVRADLTITFVARKAGFASAAEYVGEVLVADIGVPAALVRAVAGGGLSTRRPEL